jgi:hypothetical protein
MWANVVKDWNKTKVIKDDTGVYALPLRDSEEYIEVRKIYDKLKGKQKKKEIEVDKQIEKKVEVKKLVAEVKKDDKMKKADRMKKASEHISSLLSQIKKPDDIALKDAEAIIDRFKKYLLINSTVLARKGDYGVFWKEYDEYRGVTDNDLARVARQQIVLSGGNEPAYQFINKLEDYIIASSYNDDKGAYVLEKDLLMIDKLTTVALLDKAIAERKAKRKAERELTKRREKALEGLKKVASETAERNKQRKKEAEERKMMDKEDIKESNNLDQIMKISKDLNKYCKLPERVIKFPDVQPKIKNKPGDVMKQNAEYARFVKYLSTTKKKNALNVRRRAYLKKGMSPDEAIREAMNRHPEIEAFRRMEEDEL